MLEHFFPGDSELARRMRALDWSTTDLGEPARWPENLRVAVSLCLTSRIPVVMYWGPNFTVLYNDAYVSFLGDRKHPKYLGQPGRECWSEIWDTIGPMLNGVRDTGTATWSEDVLMFFARHLPREEVYVRFTFGPILARDGQTVEGIFCPCTETTEQVVAARRLETLRKLGARADGVRSPEAACRFAAAVLSENPHDIPFAAVYLVDEPGRRASLCAAVRLVQDVHPLPLTASFDDEDGPWTIAPVRRMQRALDVPDVALSPAHLENAAWPETPTRALILPIAAAAHGSLTGLLIVGVSPRCVLGGAYRTFFDLVAGHIGAALNNAHTYAAERKRAEALIELDRAKTAFFSNVSHEFRTPLALLLGPLQEVLAAPVEAIASHRSELERAHRNAMRLLRLVNSLLDFSRIEAGRIDVSYEPTDLATLTADLASNFRSVCEKAGLDLNVDCPALSESVHVDRDMWEKIVLNLLSNAFKYTLDGKIEVSLYAVPDAGSVELSIRDTGCGIPESELPRMFERFHRVTGQSGRTQEGTGIGLSLVQELVRLHGGTVRVESELDKGAAFFVRIPTGVEHLPIEKIAARRSMASTATAADAYVEEALRWLPGFARKGPDGIADVAETGSFAIERSDDDHIPRILLADDNADLREYISRLLSPRYVVEVVGDGEAALRSARSRRPDLVLTDVMMPKLDGFGLLAALRAEPALRDLPVIMLSARAGEEATAEGRAAGADDYLVKPFSARELLARVEGTIRLARARREMTEELERRVAERTAELLAAEERLRQAQKMEAVGQLTGGIAHDFNNLLTVVIGNVDSLQRHLPEQSSDRLRRAADNALLGAKRAATLTQRLLAFARRQPLEPKPVDVSRLVSGMSDLLTRTLGERIEVQIVFGAGLWRAEVDPNQLENALLNLALNARDAMPEGGKLTIETANAHLDELYAANASELTPGQYVVVAVSDTGMGMTREILDRVFEPFFTTKPVGQGTGLGLSQVYGFVKQSGGHIKLYSEVSEGTSVKIYLPRLLADADENEATRSAIVPDGQSSETVLVVEDEPAVREYSCDILRDLGYRVLEARDGESALHLLTRNEEIAVLFTDVGLPGMSGRELADTARRSNPKLKVLFTTGYARNAIVHHGRLDAGVQLIGKPFTHADLATKIRELIDRE